MTWSLLCPSASIRNGVACRCGLSGGPSPLTICILSELPISSKSLDIDFQFIFESSTSPAPTAPLQIQKFELSFKESGREGGSMKSLANLGKTWPCQEFRARKLNNWKHKHPCSFPFSFRPCPTTPPPKTNSRTLAFRQPAS